MAKSYLHTRKKKEYAASEIEKLKAEIEEKCSILHITLLTTEEVFEVLDNRISELKGENNECENI